MRGCVDSAVRTNCRRDGSRVCCGGSQLGLLVTPMIAQYLIHLSLPIALGTYAAVCALCVLCLRLIPIETVGRQMPADMDELVAVLRGGSSGGGFATDARVPRWWRRLRWRARVDGYDVRAGKRASAGSDAAVDSGKASMLP